MRNQGPAVPRPSFQRCGLETAPLGRSRQMQCAPDRIVERPCNAHGIIFLQARDSLAYLGSKYAVDGTAIIAKPAQRGLHRSNISRLHDELFVSLEVVNPSPLVPWRKVSRVYIFPLVEQTVFISLS